MYLSLTLILLSTVSWVTALPVPEIDQNTVAVPMVLRTPTPVTASIEKRQHISAPVETSTPILEALTDGVANHLQERATGTDDSFHSLLCATLKALKSEDPTLFTSLLQSCTSLTDSSSHGRKKALKGRNAVRDNPDLGTDVEAVDNGSGEAVLGISKTEKEKRQDEGLDSLL